MPIVNRIAEFASDMQVWRRYLHQNPELGFDCHNTARFVVDRLRDMGVDEIHTGIAQTGVVALIHGIGDGPVIGLRADMDALPIVEATGAEYASTVPGKMHACGHDGHTTMLLGAARYLAETRRFQGTVALIFQPAEESGGGGGVMVDEGMIERFGITQAFALHIDPHMPLGHMRTCVGPIMAAVDDFAITITGRGGHAAYPDEVIDPIPPALALVQGYNTIVSRNTDPVKQLVISTTQIQCGEADNVVPDTVFVGGTIRSFDVDVQRMAHTRMHDIARGLEAAFDVKIDVTINIGYPSTVNAAAQTELAARVARDVVGDAAFDANTGAEMGAEDFAYISQKVPGCYLFLGQGHGPTYHNAGFDFNDQAAPVGASFFARLVETAMPMGE